MLATQAMINLGEIQDPVTGTNNVNPEGARLFMDLLAVLELKTKGNLSSEEEGFLNEILVNLDQVYKKKTAPSE